MQALKYGIQKHFQASRRINTVEDAAFAKSGRVFKSVVAQLQSDRKANVKHHTPVSVADIRFMQNSLDLETPKGLRQKAFINIMTYFANRGMENLPVMTPNDFVLKDLVCCQYLSIIDKLTKIL